MKRPTRRAVLAGLAALGCPGVGLASPDVVHLSTPDWPVGSGSLGPGGFEILVASALKTLGESLDFASPPPERSLREVAAGRGAGDGPRVEAIARAYPSLRRVPEPIVDYRFVAFTRSLDGPVAGWDWAAEREVAVVRGWKILEKNLAAATLTTVRDTRLLFGLLARDRAEVVVHEEMIGRHVAESVGVEGLRVLEPPFAVRPMFLYLHERYEALVTPLAEVLRAMKADGSGKRLLEAALAPQALGAFPGFHAHWGDRA